MTTCDVDLAQLRYDDRGPGMFLTRGEVLVAVDDITAMLTATLAAAWQQRRDHPPTTAGIICAADGCLCLPDEGCPACRVAARDRRYAARRRDMQRRAPEPTDLLKTGTNVYDALRADRERIAS